VNLAGRTYLYLGAEGQAEAPAAWLRPVEDRAMRQAVLEEAAKAIAPEYLGSPTLPGLGDALTLDRTGRPYALVELTGAAPADLRAAAEGVIRVVRLEDIPAYERHPPGARCACSHPWAAHRESKAAPVDGSLGYRGCGIVGCACEWFHPAAPPRG